MNFDMFTLTTGRGVSQSWRTLEKRGPWWIKHVEDEIVYIVLVNFFIHLKYWVEKGLPSVFCYISDIWPIYAYVNIAELLISWFWIVLLTRFLDGFLPKNSKSITSANKSPFFEVLHFSCVFQKPHCHSDHAPFHLYPPHCSVLNFDPSWKYVPLTSSD